MHFCGCIESTAAKEVGHGLTLPLLASWEYGSSGIAKLPRNPISNHQWLEYTTHVFHSHVSRERQITYTLSLKRVIELLLCTLWFIERFLFRIVQRSSTKYVEDGETPYNYIRITLEKTKFLREGMQSNPKRGQKHLPPEISPLPMDLLLIPNRPGQERRAAAE